MKLCPSCKIGHHGAPDSCSVCEADLASVPRVDGAELAGMILEDKYELAELLGEGGMAWVYRAVHLGLERSVAIKILKSSARDDPAATARFEREALTVSRLNHPHIVSVIDFGHTATDLLYLVTEYVKGQMLYHLLWQEGALPVSRTYGIMHQVLAAVEEAHSAGVIHRDLKPENILVTQLNTGEDFVKVVDFGIAVLADDQRERGAEETRLVGTPGYMAPEQINGERSTARADVYALGVLVYELLAGRAPFENESPLATMTLQLTAELPRLSELQGERAFPVALDDFLAQALARDPRQRIATVAEFRQRLAAVFRDMGPVRLACDRCARPIDPQTGLCNLHAGAGLHQHLPEDGRPERSRRPSTEEVRTIVSEAAPHASLAAAITGDRLFDRDDAAREIARFLTGTGVVLEILGEVGIGKSALLEGVARSIEPLGMRVLATGADPSLARSPWYPVRNLVGQALGCGATPTSADDLCRLAAQRELDDAAAAGLTLLFGLPGPQSALSTEARRDRIHTSAVRSLISATGDGHSGVCVLVDDADEFDSASLEFFRAATRLRSWSGIKIIIASLAGVADETGDHAVLRLGPLSTDGIEALLDRRVVGADPLPGAVARDVAQQSLGNPLFIEQATDLIRDGGQPTGDLAVVLERRLSRLPPEALSTLQAIAAVGREVVADQLAPVVGDEQLFLALGLLEERGLCRVGAGRRVSPANQAIARAALGLLGPAERQALHRRVFEQLSAAGASPFVLARQAEEAGRWEQAYALRELAGDTARQLGEDEEAALVQYRRAVHIARWELLTAADAESFLDLSYKLGSALIDSGHLLGGEVVLKELLGSAQRHERIGAAARAKLATVNRDAV